MSQEQEQFDYYAPRPLGGGPPIGLFRHLKSAEKLPDRFIAGQGWVPDRWLLLKMMSGEVGPPDQISFDEAKVLLSLYLKMPS